MKRPLVDDLEAAEPASSSVQEQDNVERAGSESSDWRPLRELSVFYELRPDIRRKNLSIPADGLTGGVSHGNHDSDGE